MSQIRELRKLRDKAAKDVQRTNRRLQKLLGRLDLEEAVLRKVNQVIEKRKEALVPKVPVELPNVQA